MTKKIIRSKFQFFENIHEMEKNQPELSRQNY